MSRKPAHASRQLQLLGQQLRGQIPRDTVEGLAAMRQAIGITAVPTRIPPGRGLTQQDVSALIAARIPVAADYYGRLERGLIARPPIEILRVVARVLGMDATLWSEWWHHLYGRLPSGEEGLLPSSQAPPIWGAFFRAGLWESAADSENEVWACYEAMETWDVTRQTPNLARLWGRPLTNPILDVLTDRAARDTIMIDWEHWARLSVGRLAASIRQHRGSSRLRQIRTVIRLDPAVEAIWTQYAERPTPQYASIHRRMRHATTGRAGALVSSVADIQGSPGCTVTLLHWRAD